MADNFANALHQILIYEGGFVNKSADPGGATNRGITQRTYDWWRHSRGLPTAPVFKITETEVSSIYGQQFWLPMHCNEFGYSLALVLFDTAVQWGVHDAFVKIICPALGLSSQAACLSLFRATNDVRPLVDHICDRRVAFRKERVLRNPTQIIFLKGWIRRDENLRHLALSALQPLEQLYPTPAKTTQSPPNTSAPTVPDHGQLPHPQAPEKRDAP